MLKKRIIPVLLLKSGRLVKTKQFSELRDVGSPISSLKIYNSQSVDELVLLNIDRSVESFQALRLIVEKACEFLTAPIAVGGYVNTLESASDLISAGADKVVLNTICYESPKVVRDMVKCFGAQAVVASVDVRFNKKELKYELYSNGGKLRQAVSLEKHLNNLNYLGAGEILINSIDQDGTMSGYDIDLISLVSNKTPLPVIACGGAGNFEHLSDLLNHIDVSGLGCGSLFYFGDNNPVRVNAYLKSLGVAVKQ